MCCRDDLFMPQGPINFEARATQRSKLECAHGLHNAPNEALWCEVSGLTPKLRLPWAYTAAQEIARDIWECSAVWLHAANLPNGQVYAQNLYDDLREIINTLAGAKRSAQHTLLVSHDGLEYDRGRLGGDHHMCATSGRHFTLSVRLHPTVPDGKVLLAVAWN